MKIVPVYTFMLDAFPIPQGDLRINPNTHRLYHSNGDVLGAYRKALGMKCLAERRKAGFKEPFTGAVVLALDFYYQRPKSSKREYPTVRPDLDKLARAVGDALTGVAYVDDGQVICTRAEKHYALHNRVKVRVSHVQES